MVTYGVMAFKVKNNKDSIKALTYQVAKITTDCVDQNIRIKDCIITFGGTKDILREVKKLHSMKEFDCLLIYSPKQIADTQTEFLLFANTLKNEYKIEVKYYKD